MVIDYKPIANNVGALVESQAQYLIDLGAGGSLENGFNVGVADEFQCNKVWRQSSMIGAAVATFISNLLSIDVLDDGDLPGLVADLTSAIGAEAIAAVTGGSVIVGQGNCIFQYSSATKCLLMPHNGNSLIVNSANVAVPAAGIPLISTIPNPALAINTTYNVYLGAFSGTVSGAANNGGGLIRLTVNSTTRLCTGYIITIAGVGGTTEANGIWTITVIDATHIDLQTSAFVHAYTAGGTMSAYLCEASTTAHTTAANGTEVMSGDSTKALVGKVRTNGSTQFASDATHAHVRSWFNDPGVALQAIITGGGGVVVPAGGAYSAIPGFTLEVTSWLNEPMYIHAGFVGGDATAGPPTFSAGIQIDNPTGTPLGEYDAQVGGAGGNVPMWANHQQPMTELFHSITLNAKAGVAVGSIDGSSRSGIWAHTVGRQN